MGTTDLKLVIYILFYYIAYINMYIYLHVVLNLMYYINIQYINIL